MGKNESKLIQLQKSAGQMGRNSDVTFIYFHTEQISLTVRSRERQSRFRLEKDITGLLPYRADFA